MAEMAITTKKSTVDLIGKNAMPPLLGDNPKNDQQKEPYHAIFPSASSARHDFARYCLPTSQITKSTRSSCLSDNASPRQLEAGSCC